ncbi:cellulose biosynthesis cyclic di-GMP-binding regulatory protein BcsB [Caldalkalibacillus mannanilyticus]|uniref:cellulose biosynthesis cyclic di-GMP-binding regulatory protein BcsB n=1 Tax=Caldalkalibacillus mannanilyticus TaxID=1418 RepID=UPI00046A0CE0|nr:cellulose biosynthesis cyclic di-GMP-binding regulatory protein BcsB [Caldalkalibacillus mannanilyticus]
MKKRWIYKLITIITVLMIALAPNQPMVYGLENESKQITATNLAGKEKVLIRSNVSPLSAGSLYSFSNQPITLQGVDPSYEFFYYVPKATLGNQNYMELEYRHSELLLSTQSTLTILVNGKPLKSFFMLEEGEQSKTIRIPLGADELAQGYHKVALKAHSVVSDDLCADQYNPANWVRIEPTSFLYFDTKDTWEVSDLLTEFPYPFVELGTSDEVYGAIVVPDQPTEQVISSALHLASYLSSITVSGKVIPLMTESEWEKSKKNRDVIAIGSVESWQGDMRKIIAENHQQVQKDALQLTYFSLTNQEEEKNLLLLVTAMKDETIQEKLSVLTDPDLRSMLSGNHMTIDKLPVKTIEEKQTALTLSSFGYESLLLKQGLVASQPMYIRIPGYWKVGQESFLELKLRASSLLQAGEAKDFEKYGLTIYFNGIPKTISMADLDRSQGDLMTVIIPLDEYIRDRTNELIELRMEAHIADEKGGACYRNQNDGQWILIDNDSAFHLPYEVAKERTFRYWPAPFVNERGMDSTVFLIPQEVDGKYLTQLARVAKEMLLSTQHRNTIDIVKDTPAAKEKLMHHHVVILGDASQYQALDTLEELLLVQREKGQLQVSDFHALNETTAYVAWLQPSVWDENRTMLIIQHTDVGENEKGNFIHPALLRSLTSEPRDSVLLTMNHAQQIHHLPATLEQETEFVDPPEKSKEDDQSLPYWIFLIIFAVFLIAFYVFMKLWRRQSQVKE